MISIKINKLTVGTQIATICNVYKDKARTELAHTIRITEDIFSFFVPVMPPAGKTWYIEVARVFEEKGKEIQDVLKKVYETTGVIPRGGPFKKNSAVGIVNASAKKYIDINVSPTLGKFVSRIDAWFKVEGIDGITHFYTLHPPKLEVAKNKLPRSGKYTIWVSIGSTGQMGHVSTFKDVKINVDKLHITIPKNIHPGQDIVAKCYGSPDKITLLNFKDEELPISVDSNNYVTIAGSFIRPDTTLTLKMVKGGESTLQTIYIDADILGNEEAKEYDFSLTHPKRATSEEIRATTIAKTEYFAVPKANALLIYKDVGNLAITKPYADFTGPTFDPMTVDKVLSHNRHRHTLFTRDNSIIEIKDKIVKVTKGDPTIVGQYVSTFTRDVYLCLRKTKVAVPEGETEKPDEFGIYSVTINTTVDEADPVFTLLTKLDGKTMYTDIVRVSKGDYVITGSDRRLVYNVFDKVAEIQGDDIIEFPNVQHRIFRKDNVLLMVAEDGSVMSHNLNNNIMKVETDKLPGNMSGTLQFENGHIYLYKGSDSYTLS